MDGDGARRRWRPPWVLGIAAILMLGMVSGAAATVLNYQPLGFLGGLSGCGRATDVPLAQTKTHNFGTECEFAYREGGTFEYRFDLRNTGAWGVTITGFDLPRNRVFEPVGVFVVPFRHDAPEAPLGIRALGSHQSVTLSFQYRYRPCPEGNDSTELVQVWATHKVRYRVAGINRTGEFRIPNPIAVHMPTNGCLGS